MTRVRIPRPDAEEDITAEQVAASTRCVCGHRKNSHRGATNRGGCKATIHTYGTSNCPCSRFLDAASPKGLAVLVARDERAKRDIESDDESVSIASAEQRHPFAELADIVGPAMGSGIPSRGETAECGPGPRAPIYGTDIERAKCMFRGRLALRAVEDQRERTRQGERRAAVETADDDSAARGAGESEE